MKNSDASASVVREFPGENCSLCQLYRLLYFSDQNAIVRQLWPKSLLTVNIFDHAFLDFEHPEQKDIFHHEHRNLMIWSTGSKFNLVNIQVTAFLSARVAERRAKFMPYRQRLVTGLLQPNIQKHRMSISCKFRLVL